MDTRLSQSPRRAGLSLIDQGPMNSILRKKLGLLGKGGEGVSTSQSSNIYLPSLRGRL